MTTQLSHPHWQRGVCYRLHGVVLAPGRRDGSNARHHLQDLFNRRLRQGRCFRTPCLGWSEFTCSYWGPFREGVTEVDTNVSLTVPSMLRCVWDRPTAGQYSPKFDQDVAVGMVSGGVMEYKLPAYQLSGMNREGNADAQ